MVLTNVSNKGFIDRTGQRFGRWYVVCRFPQNKKVRWICKCDCGTQRDVAVSDLTSGKSSSCGCYQKDKVGTTLPKLHKREYHSWMGMKQRCLYKKHIEWHRYGGRGITVCDEWKNSFETFFIDLGTCPQGMSLDRINTNGPYSPENCRWATKAEQSANTSRNIYVDYGGEKLTLKQLAHCLGVSYSRLHSQFRRRGLSLEEAIAKVKEPGINRPYRYRPESLHD